MQYIECADDKNIDSGEVVRAVQRDGICVLQHVLSDREIRDLRREVMALASITEDWLVHNQSSTGFFFSFSPLVARKLHYDDRISHISSVFARPAFKNICRRYLGTGWFIERIVLDRKDVGPEPLTGWHADQFERCGKCVKFMLYLNDTDSGNGAFSYVPRSHRLISYLVERIHNDGLDNRAAHTYEEILALARERLVVDGAWPGEIRAIIEEVATHICSSELSDDHYSIAAPAGSVVVFDANGIHRGGAVAQRERFIIRSHCRDFHVANVLSSKVALGTFLERLYFRMTAPAGRPRLV